MDREDRDRFPPGTLYLERILDHSHAETVLHPTPSSDPNDPLNWPKWYKCLNFALVCYYTLMVFVNVDIGTVIWADLNEDLGISFNVMNISFGVNCAGLAVGCVLLIPFALKYGRRVVYLVSIVVSFATCIWQARMRTGGDLLGANLLSGLAGATSETICQMTIADVFFVHQRGAANAVYLFMVNAGSFLALIPAGYVAESQGWRWIWWWTAILLAVCLGLFLFLYEDTKFSPAESSKHTQQSNQESPPTPDVDAKSSRPHTAEVTESHMVALDDSIPRKPYAQRVALLNTTPGWATFFRHIYQPFITLVTFPAITYTALTYGSLLAWFSVTVTVYSVYFTLPPYNFTPAGIGLLNLAPFTGGMIGSVFAGFFADRSIIWLSKRNNGIFEPEMRLWTAIPGVIIMPFSLLWFGLATAHGLHWIVPAVGLAFFGFGFVVLGDVALTYAMDCYKDIIGDAFVGIVFVRNVFATVIATTITPWINGVGLSNVFVISTVLAFLLSILAIPMMVWGKKMRHLTTDRYALYSGRQYASRKD